MKEEKSNKNDQLPKKKGIIKYVIIALAIVVLPVTLIVLDKMFFVVETSVPVFWGKDGKQFIFAYKDRNGDNIPNLVSLMVSDNKILFDIGSVRPILDLLHGEKNFTEEDIKVANGFVAVDSNHNLISESNKKGMSESATDFILITEVIFNNTITGESYSTKWQYHPEYEAIENCDIKQFRVPFVKNNNSYRAKTNSTAGYHAVISLDKLIELYAPGVQFKYEDDALYFW